MSIEEANKLDEIFNAAREQGFPDGFTPAYGYRDGGNPYVREEVVCLKVPNGSSLVFLADWKKPETLPVLPLKTHGKMYHVGWDIPTVWAVDAADNCWMDNAHGHALAKVNTLQLINSVKGSGDEGMLERIYLALGKKKPMPKWMQTALHQGWAPPATFNRNDYEEDT